MRLYPGDLVVRNTSWRPDDPPRVFLQRTPDAVNEVIVEFKRDTFALVVAVTWVQMAAQFGGMWCLLVYKDRLGWTLCGECELVSGDPATRRGD